MTTGASFSTVDEHELYPTIVDHWRARGFYAAASVSDPGGSRVELDVVAFTPELDDVRIVEAKVSPSTALVTQCVDRLRYAERVYAAAPGESARELIAKAQGSPAGKLGVLAAFDREVEVLREAEPAPEHRKPGKAHVVERQLRSRLADGEAMRPR